MILRKAEDEIDQGRVDSLNDEVGQETEGLIEIRKERLSL